MAYNSEAVMWGEFIAKQKPGAQGRASSRSTTTSARSYSTTFEKVAADKGLTIVEASCTRAPATSIDNEVTSDPRVEPRRGAR